MTTAISIQAALAQVERRKITVQEYDAMIAAHIFHEDERIELIEGELLQMAPIGDTHMTVSFNLSTLFAPLVIERKAIFGMQGSIRLARSEPEPDFTLLRYVARYRGGVPKASEVALLVEISDSTFDYDTTTKRSLYAEATIPEYWVIDVNRETVLQYWQPAQKEYQQSRRYTLSEIITSVSFPTFAVTVAEVFGKDIPAPPQA